MTEFTQAPVLPNYLEADDQARRILSLVIARQSAQFVSHAAIAKVKLSTLQLKEGIKAKIVGKDGRNLRYFEEQSGVDLLLDEEANAVVLSSFDPFRREVARFALESLVRDGRIQPPRIEQILAESRIQVDLSVREAGQSAATELGVNQVHPGILRVLGTLKFRNSFGQNQLDHARETGWLCGSLASELGYDVALARRAGLLHDIGKGLDQTHDEGHARAGAQFVERFGERPEVVQAIAAHHEEVEPYSWLDHLVLAADAISGARPGARRGSTQIVQERAQKMENIAREATGVRVAYAVQAGRELRVFVDSDTVSDGEMSKIARQIVDRIRSEVEFPGQIKVTVLRECRVVEVASR